VIEKNPIRAPKLNTRNPTRPVATHDDQWDLLRHTDAVDPQSLFGCFLRLLDASGSRVTGLCHIQASDLDFNAASGAPSGRVKKCGFRKV
jgi:site-specific recombinase XerD